jgi:hypothetical protein
VSAATPTTVATAKLAAAVPNRRIGILVPMPPLRGRAGANELSPPQCNVVNRKIPWILPYCDHARNWILAIADLSVNLGTGTFVTGTETRGNAERSQTMVIVDTSILASIRGMVFIA